MTPTHGISGIPTKLEAKIIEHDLDDLFGSKIKTSTSKEVEGGKYMVFISVEDDLVGDLVLAGVDKYLKERINDKRDYARRNGLPGTWHPYQRRINSNSK